MKEFSQIKSLIDVLIITFFLMTVSAQYREFQIESDELCSLVKRRKIKLLDYGSHSGLLVRQTRLNDHSYTWAFDLDCKFLVQAPSLISTTGIAVVIQSLEFRKNKTTGECIDYIRFQRKDGIKSQMFCGKISAFTRFEMEMNAITFGERTIVDNAFVDGKGEMEVVIHVAKEPLEKNEKMELSLAFTAYKICREVIYKKMDNFRSCSDNFGDYCIPVAFFGDNVVNCPFADCLDEAGDCYKWYPKPNPESNSDKILLGALTSICLIFGLFIVCMWISKTFKLFCWAPCFANSSTTSQESPSHLRTIEMNEQGASTAQSQSQANATAPSVDEDKDLPPSYESLFPTSRHCKCCKKNNSSACSDSSEDYQYKVTCYF